jgi:glycosyltransferase involved in cell wall biosynthesis
MPEQKLHIAVISTWYPTPGDTGGVFVRDQADALIDAGNKVAIFMFQYFSLTEWLQKKLKREPLTNWIKGRKVKPIKGNFVNIIPTRFFSNPLQAQKKHFLSYIKKKFDNYITLNGKPDIIHHHGVANYCYITAYLSKTFSIPYVITEHTVFTDKISHFTKYETEEERLQMIQHAAIRIAVSNFHAEYNSQLFHVPFDMLPNMINNDFANVPLPPFPKSTNPFYFLSVGSLTRIKRHDILIEAFTKTFKGKMQVRLNTVGNGESWKELTSLVNTLGMQTQIQLLGYMELSEVIKQMDNSHVIVISSEKESFSMVAAESLFRGNPVLTTRCKGPEDFINDRNGLICEPNDVNDMGKKMLEIYNSYNSFAPLQIAEDAKNKFSEQVVAARLEEVYRKVISLSYLLPGKNNGNQ